MRVAYALPSVAFSAGTTGGVIDLRLLPKTLFGRICHLRKIELEFPLTLTYTTAPTTVGINNVFTRFDLWDGKLARFVGGLNHVRALERIYTGKNRVPDAVTAASTVQTWFRRTLHLGPANFAGYKTGTDFCVPCGMLETGVIQLNHGQLTDFSADTTVATCTAKVVAYLDLLDEVRIPPAYQALTFSATGGDITLPGRALYTHVFMAASSAYADYTTGQVGNITLDLGFGPVVSQIAAGPHHASYQDDYEVSEVGTFHGEPGATATDIAGRIVNRSSQTALATNQKDLQAVLWSSPNEKLSKCQNAESAARLRWDGSLTTSIVHVGRILPQTANVVIANMAQALGSLNLKPSAQPQIKTFSKKPYRGPFGDYMPWVVKV